MSTFVRLGFLIGLKLCEATTVLASDATFTKLADAAPHGAMVQKAVTQGRVLYAGDQLGVVAATSTTDFHVLWSKRIEPRPGYPRGVTGIAASPDGSFVLASVKDGRVIYLDAKTGAVFDEVMIQGGSEITDLVISADSDFALAGSSDGIIYRWNVASHDSEVLGVMDWSISDITFYDRNSILVTDSKSVKIWDIEARVVKRIILDPDIFGSDAFWVNSIGYSGNIQYVIVTSSRAAFLYNVSDGSRVATYKPSADNELRHAVLSEDMTEVMTIDGGGGVAVFDPFSGVQVFDTFAFTGTAVSIMVALPEKGHFALGGLTLDVFGGGFKPTFGIWDYHRRITREQ